MVHGVQLYRSESMAYIIALDSTCTNRIYSIKFNVCQNDISKYMPYL